MNFKIFFICHQDDESLRVKFESCLNLMPEEVSSCLEIIPQQHLLESNSFELDPVSLSNKLAFYQAPKLKEEFLSHYNLWSKMIKENIDLCLIVNDSIIPSDIISFLSCNPDIDENLDIFPISNLKNLSSAYFISKVGAKKIKQLSEDLSWLGNIIKIRPEIDFGFNKLANYKAFINEPIQTWKKKFKISITLSQLIKFCAQNQTVSFKHVPCCNEYPHLKGMLAFRSRTDKSPIFGEMTEAEINKLISSQKFENRNLIEPVNSKKIDFIYYINLDESVDRKAEIESRLNLLDLPYERFSAIRPDPQSCDKLEEYHEYHKRQQFFYCARYLGEYEKSEQYELGSLGCYLSHYKLICQIADMNEQNQNILIIEDDCKINKQNFAVANKKLSELLERGEEWDILRSTWSSSINLEKIKYCHPLSNSFETYMHRHIYQRINEISTDYKLVSPTVHALYGGTHFQVINSNSAKKIKKYLEEETIIPIDALYTTTALDVFHAKMNVEHTFGNSIINPNEL